MSMERPQWASVDIDMDKPSVARVYDYLLGGSHNFAVDRELAHQGMAAMPDLPVYAQINRAFLHRAVRFLVDSGVRQFLDLGSGIPTVGNVHEIAQAAAPDTRVAYVDIDPVAVVHSRSILSGNDRAVAVLEDARNPEAILDHPEIRRLIDLDEPVALLMVALLHYLPDEDDPYDVVTRFAERLAPGSFLVISHGNNEALEEAGTREVMNLSRRTPTGLYNRSRAEIERFFAGFEMVEPGLVWAEQWRPAYPEDVRERPELSGSLAGVARIP
jgi:trans-aconitate methyltransferase